MKKVWATGAGSARPVVSMMIASKSLTFLCHFFHHHQITADCTTDTPIHHLDHLFISILREDTLIDPHLTKLIFDNRKSHPMLLITQNMIQKSCFPSSKETMSRESFFSDMVDSSTSLDKRTTSKMLNARAPS